MRVMVTGATGLVGGHTVRALLDAGHEVSALVRDAERLRATMDALGVDAPDHVVGDMTDRSAVGEALEGCDALVHCAAVVSMDRRAERDMLRANPEGLRTVVGAGVRAGLDPIIHTSSTSALFRPGAGPLTTTMPVADCALPYGRSKALCELEARRYQDRGAPVVITYPSGILGPPAGAALGETAEQMSGFVRSGVMPTRRAAISVVDVRDLAAANVALLTPGMGPRRVMCGGHLLTMEDLAELLRELTGRRFPIPPVPPAALRGAGHAMDAARRVLPVQGPVSAEAMTLVTRWQGTEDTWSELGIEPRDVRGTLEESLLAWRAAGLVHDAHLGRLAAGTGAGSTGTSTPPLRRPKGLRLPASVMASRPLRRVGPTVFPPVHRFVMRVTGGRTMLDSRAQPMLLLHTTGAKSGQLRETPLATVPRAGGSFLVVGSNFAREHHPAWTANLLAHPRATVTFRGRTSEVTARLLAGDERARCWEEALGWYPGWQGYCEVTDREFRLFELSPTGR